MITPVVKQDVQFNIFVDALPLVIAIAVLAITASILLQWPR